MRALIFLIAILIIPYISHSQEVQVNKEYLKKLINEFNSQGDIIELRITFWEDNLWSEDNLTELRTLVGYLNVKKDYKILIENHTDCRGRKEYNEQVSEFRAKEIQRRLMLEGIPVQKVSYIGKGETEPKVKCSCNQCSEQDHLKNQRTTIKIIEMRPSVDIEEDKKHSDDSWKTLENQEEIYADVCINSEGELVFVRPDIEVVEGQNDEVTSLIVDLAHKVSFTKDSKEIQCGYIKFRIKK